MKTKYMVYTKDANCEEEIQTILDTYADAMDYAADNTQAGTQYIAKFTTMKIVKFDGRNYSYEEVQ